MKIKNECGWFGKLTGRLMRKRASTGMRKTYFSAHGVFNRLKTQKEAMLHKRKFHRMSTETGMKQIVTYNTMELMEEHKKNRLSLTMKKIVSL